MKTFFTRTISGAVYAAIIIGSIFAGPVIFGLTMGIFMGLGILEFHSIIKRTGNEPSLALLLISSYLIYLTGYLITLSILPARAAGVGIAVFFLALVIQFFLHSDKAIERTGMILLGISYLAFPLFLTNLLFYGDFSFDGKVIYALLGLFIITWINDTFAYMIGSLAGRHKLAERISPNKTWEGSAGGFIFSMAGAFVLSLIFEQTGLMQWITMALVIVVAGTFGDLLESVMKRRTGLKESGKMIPGHGGILDRIDSILIATPFLFILIYFILN